MARLPYGSGKKTAPSARKGWRFGAAVGVALAALAPSLTHCYATGQGSSPPLDRLYFPVGLAVSHGGKALYALNSDFDLQYNGGTIQALDLTAIRRDALLAITRPYHSALPLARPEERPEGADTLSCAEISLPGVRKDGTARPLGESCAPPVLASAYVRDAAVIGAFGTDLQISRNRALLDPPPGQARLGPRAKDRLFAPLRGSAAVLWVDVDSDLGAGDPMKLDCGTRVDARCDAIHLTGPNPDNEPQNTRKLTLPGEPFGLAQGQDGSSMVVTHQNDTKATLVTTGLPYTCENGAPPCDRPAVQFVAEGVRTGGTSIVSVPYDGEAFAAGKIPKPAFLGTSRLVAEIGLLREYPDQTDGVASTLRRPFLSRERAYPLTIAAGGTDSRGIVLDPSPRIACKARVKRDGRPAADVEKDLVACARKPLRVFVANRSPAALLVGELGSDVGNDTIDAFDPEKLTFYDSIPLTQGPSKVFLAPIVDANGKYVLRVFVVCFDASSIFVIDPETRELENTIRVEAGPFAMAFDPFDPTKVATGETVLTENVAVPALGDTPVRKYRFAYVASFTKSAIQVVDLDNSVTNKDTFEKVVFTVGEPTLPKGVK